MTTTTYFNVGDRVTAQVTAQGVVEGQSYDVVGVNEHRTPFGNFVAYSVSPVDGDDIYRVTNAHLILRRV